jgi:hypothetical protein
MCAFLTYFYPLAANHHPNVSLKSKKSGKHVAAGTLEVFRRFSIFFQNFGSTQAPIKDLLGGPFWTRTAWVGKARTEKKIAFSCIINTK